MRDPIDELQTPQGLQDCLRDFVIKYLCQRHGGAPPIWATVGSGPEQACGEFVLYMLSNALIAELDETCDAGTVFLDEVVSKIKNVHAL